MFLFSQDEKTVTKLMSEVQETQEILNKHKTESKVRHIIHTVYMYIDYL